MGDLAAAALAASNITELTYPDPRGMQGAAGLDVLCEPAVATGTLNTATALDAVGNDPLLGGAA